MTAADSPELARLRAELQTTQQQLAAARAALGDFAYTVSHDLRAHVRHIQAYAGIVCEDWPQAPTDVLGHLDTITQAALAMGRQIDGLMVWAQLDRVALAREPLDWPALVAQAQRTVAEPAPARPVRWHLPSDWPSVHGDAALMGQLLCHLFSNALKFTRACPHAEITVGWQQMEPGAAALGAAQAPQCLVFVRDNGVGYNPQGQDKLFHVFQRLHSAREFEGQGLGLALARKIVERHGGTISAEGAPDQGCCIRFTLPLAASSTA